MVICMRYWIIDSIIYRFFEFGFERVRGAASDEDVVFASGRYPTAHGNALSLAIGVLLDHATVRSDYDDCPSYQLRTDLL
jgi:hypothetical protein